MVDCLPILSEIMPAKIRPPALPTAKTATARKDRSPRDFFARSEQKLMKVRPAPAPGEDVASVEGRALRRQVEALLVELDDATDLVRRRRQREEAVVGADEEARAVSTQSGRRGPPTPGSTTATWMVPAGK